MDVKPQRRQLFLYSLGFITLSSISLPTIVNLFTMDNNRAALKYSIIFLNVFIFLLSLFCFYKFFSSFSFAPLRDIYEDSDDEEVNNPIPDYIRKQTVYQDELFSDGRYYIDEEKTPEDKKLLKDMTMKEMLLNSFQYNEDDSIVAKKEEDMEELANMIQEGSREELEENAYVNPYVFNLTVAKPDQEGIRIAKVGRQEGEYAGKDPMAVAIGIQYEDFEDVTNKAIELGKQIDRKLHLEPKKKAPEEVN